MPRDAHGKSLGQASNDNGSENEMNTRPKPAIASVCLGLLLWLPSCTTAPADTRPLGMQPDGGQLHPQAQYLPYRDAPRINLVLNDSASVGNRLDAFRSSSDAGVRVGADSTAPFGEVYTVIAVGDAVGVFDPYQNGLHLVGRDGNMGVTIGRAGTGPGEFRRPTAVLSPHPDTVLIADVMRKLEVFVRDRAKGEWRPARTVQLDFSITDICRLGDRYYAYGYAAPGTGGPIRELDGHFAVVRQFGEAYTSQHEGINHTFAPHRLACAPSSDRLVLAPTAALGEIYLMRTTGEVEHILHWSDFAAFRIAEEEAGGSSVSGGEAGVNRLRGLSYLRDGIVLAQYDLMSREDLREKRDPSAVYSLAIDTRNGKVVARSAEVPLISVIDPATHAVHLSEPWPGIRLVGTGQ
jgi:hypothetical protein